MLNLPLIEDKLALRANLGYFDNDGYIDNVRLGVNRTSTGTARSPAGSHCWRNRSIRCKSSSLTTISAASYGDGPSEAFEMLGDERVDTYAANCEGQRRAARPTCR